MLPNPQNTTKPQAVIYCRVSTKHQVDEGNSLSTQERLCREYALKQGYEVAAVYIEKGESAKTKDRTELQKMMSFCAIKKNNVSYVVVYKLDRFSRNTDDYSYLRIILKRYGIFIKSTTEYFENTPAGRFMENIISNVSQFDNDVRTERAVNGSRDAMVEGRYVWSAPYGYSNIKVGGRGNIAPNDNAPIVRRAFEEVAKNQCPIEEIRKSMFYSGLTTHMNKPLSRAQFYRMLKNVVYSGWIVKFGERHKGIYEPIVSDELFEQVQRVLNYRTRKNYTYNCKHPDFPLRRFVTHPNGMKLTGSWNQGKVQKYPYYRYMCRMMNFPKESLESQFMAFMDTFKLEDDQYEDLKKKLKGALEKGVKYRLKDRNKVLQEVKELKLKQSLLIEKNIQGVISNELLRDQLVLIDKQLLELNSKLYIEPTYKVNLEELITKAKTLLTNPSEVWKTANNDNKLRFQVFEFPHGVTFDGEIFQTPEICRLFKVKDLFLPNSSHGAGVKKKVIKFHPKVANLPSLNGDKHPLRSKYTVKKYWQEIVEDLIEVNSILAEEITDPS
jgi:site-specific DNA recombinase